MALVTDPGADDADSYLSVSDADAYFLGNPHATAWTAATTQNKEWALKQATRMIDESYSWRGEITFSDQALSWPRAGLYDPESRTLDSEEIPRFLEIATAEIALAMLDEARTSDPDSMGIKEVTAGSVKVVFDSYDRKKLIPSFVDLLLAFYSYDGLQGGINVPLLRV